MRITKRQFPLLFSITFTLLYLLYHVVFETGFFEKNIYVIIGYILVLFIVAFGMSKLLIYLFFRRKG